MSRRVLRNATALTASLLLAAGTGVAVAPANAADPSPWEVIASGLNNPRLLTFAKDGALYVAEAGTGALGTHTDHPACLTGGEGSVVCFGSTGSITKVTRHSQRRVVTGLPSLADKGDGTASDPAGSSALGPADVVVTGSRKLVISLGLGNNPAVRKQLPHAAKALGTLIEVKLKHHGDSDHDGDSDEHTHSDHHHWTQIADIAGFEAKSNPIDDPDSDPVGIVRKDSHYVVADAGGNTIVRTGHEGHISTVAAFPDVMVDAPAFLNLPAGTQIPMQFVPTSVVVGPDGAYYVSQLTGFPFPVGAAKIWRVRPGHQPTVYASGLTNVTDLAFARDGSLYAVEIAAQGLLNGPVGALVHIPRGGGAPAVVAGGLFAPYGVALHHDSAYVTTGSVAAGGGQVIRIPLG